MKRITNPPKGKKKKGQMRRIAGLLLLLLCIAGSQAEFFPSCTVTASSYTAGSAPPTLSVILYANASITLSATTNHPNPLYPLLRFTNVSNSAPLYPFYGANYTINSTQNTIIIPLRYRRGQLGTVQVSYTKLTNQPFYLLVGGSIVPSFTLTCNTSHINTLYRSLIVTPVATGIKEVHFFFTGNVKRCNEDYQVFNNSWFTFVGRLNDPACGGFCNQSFLTSGPCNTTNSPGLVPYNGQLNHWYCIANTNLTDILWAEYSLTDYRICDAVDNTSVTSYGDEVITGNRQGVRIYKGLSSTTNTLTAVVQPASTVTSDLYDRVIVNTILPPTSFANFSTNRPCLWVYVPSTLRSVQCCIPANYSWARPDSTEYACATSFSLRARETPYFRLLGTSLFTYDLPDKPPSSYAVQVPGISEVGSTAATVIATYRVNGIYRVDDNTIQVEFNHAMTQQPWPANLLVYNSDSGALYNATNVTRVSGSKYNFGFNTANTLPALGSTFKGYYLAWRFDDGLPDESISPWAVEQVITAVPDTTASSSSCDDPSCLSTGYAAIYWTAIVLAIFFVFGFIYSIMHHCRESGSTYIKGPP